MTEKQEKIIQAALELFAREGYHATSTSKVARHAGVSEGLIFRHFENKKGLLRAIIRVGEERLQSLYAAIVLESDPKKAVKKAIELPFTVPESEYGFWRLQYKLKWELPDYTPGKMEPLRIALSNAFEKLDYASPKMEAEFLIHFLDGLGSGLLKNDVVEKEKLRQHLLTIYEV
ncbi:TetR/AcrR family transcriptional regulator [Tunicatimonas pelagia]|uniref:TetR/AcrR family transcriptional regulator n=1 Tax=Tunicatimonas pelagia TaxID=931531 RepID=UPI002665F892|nr:helix-turn-helix domain-containing protein [Tunicatimonas pelagia]WKN42940.1 helix-turn-helix domain containing protein [Tunicatimonas pelagia]